MTSRILRKLIPAIAAVAVASVAHAQSTSELFDRVSGSVCTIAAIDDNDNLLRRGSGFVLTDGRLVTNAHVLAGFQRAEVKCGDQIAEAVGGIFTDRIRKIDNAPVSIRFPEPSQRRFFICG